MKKKYNSYDEYHDRLNDSIGGYFGNTYLLTEFDIFSKGKYFDQNFVSTVDAWNSIPAWMPNDYKKYINKKVRIKHGLDDDKVYTMKGFAYDIHDFYWVLLAEDGKTHYHTCVGGIEEIE